MMLEEAYEAFEAVEPAAEGKPLELRDELGDLLFQIVFYAQVAKERGDFSIDDVTNTIHEKMVRRHPHVFGDADARAAGAAKGMWERIKAEERRGGRFTISSLGGIGGTGFTPIVNAPEVAILGVTRSATKPVWNGSEFAPRLMLPLSLSYDHRIIDGAAAARFTAYLVGVLSDLRRVLL